ncbi:MAG: glycine zipper domain-containing protein [Pseudomonadota bacterium]
MIDFNEFSLFCPIDLSLLKFKKGGKAMRSNFLVSGVLVIFFMSMLSSCATIPEEHKGAATGVGVGAATGAVAGALLGKDTKSAVLGALAGALVGGAIGHYGYDQKKSRDETQQTYNYKSAYGTVLTLEDVSSVPKRISPGQTVELNMTYAILNPSPDVQTNITETRTIMHNGIQVGRPEVKVTRPDGTWTSSIPLHLPANAEKGTYVVISEIQSDNVKDSREFTFTVI